LCILVQENAIKSEEIQGSSKVVTTVVLHVVVVFSFKREFFGEVENASRQTLGLRHSPRLLARRGSSRGSFGKCCSSHAVNSKGAPASAGCSGAGSGRCKRKPQKNPRSLLNTDSLPDFFEMEFTSVLSSYTDFDPVETRGIVDATDTQNVASCAVNRFIDINFDSPFSCSLYSEHNCERNEDIILVKGNGAMCCEECDETQSTETSNPPLTNPEIPTQVSSLVIGESEVSITFQTNNI
jgi:hypothetical protein